MATATKPRTIQGLQGHTGEWVAIVDDRVVASAASLTVLREQVRDRYVERFFRVPPPRRGAGIFL
jgi:Family of unknown function (DUF5678)